MIFRQLFDPQSSTYTYLLADPRTHEALLIDSVFEQFERDRALLRELELRLLYCLETHVHADHVTAAWRFAKTSNARIALSQHSGAEGADVYLAEGDVVSAGSVRLIVRETPGHTNGCVTYVNADARLAFTGDALLIRAAGRTDFQQGDARALYRSITQKIFTLPDDYLLYPAHDYSGRTVTTVGEEKRWNPRVGGEANESDFVGYMNNLGLAHPKQIDVAVPANLVCGRPANDVPAEPPAWGPVTHTFAGTSEIDPLWVHDHRQQVTLIDVREAAELQGELGRIDGALHIPLGELNDKLSEIPRDKPVVCICRSGRRSAQATVLLEKAGIRDAANVTGGMIRWRALRL